MNARVTLALVAVLLTACDSPSPAVTRTTQFLGITPPDERPSQTTRLLVDRSGVPAEAILWEEVQAAIDDTATRPAPSCIELWSMGATGDAVRRDAEVCVEPRERGTKAARAAAARFTASARLALHRAAASSPPAADGSPIAETMCRVALTPTAAASSQLIVLTDGEEASAVAMMDCRKLPSPEAFQRALHEARILEPSSLANVDVRVVLLRSVPRAGCPQSLRRDLELQALWKTALLHASAKSVRFDVSTARAEVAP